MRGLPLILLGAVSILGSGPEERPSTIPQELTVPPWSPNRQLSPRVYEVLRTPTPPIIDGHLSDPSWGAVSWSEDFVDIRGVEEPTPHLRTRVKLLWDNNFLYVGAELEEPHLWATLSKRDAIIYRDDDFELFLDPDGDGEAYFEVEINALGAVFDLFLDRPYKEGGRAHTNWDLPGLKTGIALHGTLNDPSDEDEGWTVEMAIPWKELVPPLESQPSSGRPPGPGDEWRMNFSRVDWNLEIVTDRESGRPTYRKAVAPTRGNRHPEENWVWAPQGEINMHIPEKWGVVRFVGPGEGGGGQ